MELVFAKEKFLYKLFNQFAKTYVCFPLSLFNVKWGIKPKGKRLIISIYVALGQALEFVKI